jgi:membrane-bound ClpP family serine protease
MDHFTELKELWQQTVSKQPLDYSQTVKLADGYRKNQVMKTVSAFAMLLTTFGIISYVAILYPSQLIITKIGFVSILLAIAGSLFFITNMVSTLFKKEKTTSDNKTYLNQLKEFQRKQNFIHTKGISVYFILLSVGLALSMFEITRRNVAFAIGAYLVTVAWIALNWFYFRPRVIKKQKQKIKEVIDRLEEIEKQFL